MELGDISARRQANAKFRFATGMGVILFKALPDFGRRISNNRICARVVIGRAVEHSYAECPLFEFITGPPNSLLNDEPQKCRIAFTVLEQRRSQDSVELL